MSHLTYFCGKAVFMFTFLFLLLGGFVSAGFGQKAGETEQSSTATGSASISGTVQDSSGAVIPDAQISLMGPDGRVQKVVSANEQGQFRFASLGHGPFRVAIMSSGLSPFLSPEITLANRQSYGLQTVTLAIASTTTDVQVTATEQEIADAQLKTEVSQRIFGLLPNFYTSFIHDAAPLTARQKFTLASRSVIDPSQFVLAGAAAGVEQYNRSYAGYGFGAAGYAKRYAAAFGDHLTGTLISFAVLPSILHQDPRYFYQGSGSVKSRIIHALLSAVLTRDDHGATQPNYSFILGDLASGGLSNLYYPHADRGAGLLFRNTGLGILGRAGDSLLREFILKRLTTHAPPTSNGKP